MFFFLIYNHFNSKSNYLQKAVLPLRLSFIITLFSEVLDYVKDV